MFSEQGIPCANLSADSSINQSSHNLHRNRRLCRSVSGYTLHTGGGGNLFLQIQSPVSYTTHRVKEMYIFLLSTCKAYYIHCKQFFENIRQYQNGPRGESKAMILSRYEVDEHLTFYSHVNVNCNQNLFLRRNAFEVSLPCCQIFNKLLVIFQKVKLFKRKRRDGYIFKLKLEHGVIYS